MKRHSYRTKPSAWNINKLFKKLKRNAFGIMISYTSAILIDDITSSNSFSQIVKNLISVRQPAILLMWTIIALTACVFVTELITRIVVESQSLSKKFKETMDAHTARLLSSVGQNECSWGYNMNIHRCRNLKGWKPDEIFVAKYDDNEYQFPKDNKKLQGYNATAYKEYSSSAKMQDCIRQRNDKTRYAITNIVPNYNNTDKRVEIHIKKTKWSALSFHWDYFRQIDENGNELHGKKDFENTGKIIKEAFLDSTDMSQFWINSFCLHLIIETKDEKAILARISKNKANDYPAKWAATIGEQIEESDFYDGTRNEMYDDFVERWVKRALMEEFDISDRKSFDGYSEYEDFVVEDSLRVLSFDMEADIYNIALDCVIQLNKSIDEIRNTKGIWIDSEENTELKAVDLSEIRKILLDYPMNQKEYHPSTYLRLLMFLLYKEGAKATCDLIN